MSHQAEKIIKLDFQGYWHVGSGRGEGYHLDSVCLKDKNGLPFVAGKQLKGLLRHAVRRAEAWGWYLGYNLSAGKIKTFEGLLFGSDNQLNSRFDTFSGMLFVDNAHLAKQEYEFLASNQNASIRQQLFSSLYQTAIDGETGTAIEHSLRGIEVVLPCQLYSELSLKLTAQDKDALTQQKAVMEQNLVWQIIEKALPLIDAIGAHRSRGLGEVIVSFDE